VQEEVIAGGIIQKPNQSVEHYVSPGADAG
jgi:hypothetical protein